MPSNPNWVQVSVGGYHTCGLKTDGTLACWGYNSAGQTAVPSNPNWVQVSGGGEHTCGLKADGMLRCWGDNGYGQAPVITLAPDALPNAMFGVAYTQNLSASGGSATPYTFSVLSGAVPLRPGPQRRRHVERHTGRAAGASNFTAQAKDANNIAGTRDYALTVDRASTSTTITSATPDPSEVGQSVTVQFSVTSAGGTPTGDVTVGDGTVSCTATVAAGHCALTFTTAGPKTLTASYAGDANFAASVSAGVGHRVNVANTSTTTIISDAPDPSAVGQSVTVQFSVTSAGGTPTGDVTVGDGTVSCTATVAAGQCALTFTTAGAKTLTASYAGDANFSSSVSAGESHQVNPASTTTTITSDAPDPSELGQSVTVQFSVTSAGGTPTGDVTVGDGTVSCTATVAAGQCAVTFTTAGPKTLTASYAGDANFAPSVSAAESHQVNRFSTTTTITSDAPDPSVVGQSVTVQFSVTSAAARRRATSRSAMARSRALRPLRWVTAR